MKLLFILLVFSSQSFAGEYIQPNQLPFGQSLEFSGKYEYYYFYEDGRLEKRWYEGNIIGRPDPRRNPLAKEWGVWTTHANSDNSINLMLGTTNCVYEIEKISDTFVFRVSTLSKLSGQFCQQKLLKKE